MIAVISTLLRSCGLDIIYYAIIIGHRIGFFQKKKFGVFAGILPTEIKHFSNCSDE